MEAKSLQSPEQSVQNSNFHRHQRRRSNHPRKPVARTLGVAVFRNSSGSRPGYAVAAKAIKKERSAVREAENGTRNCRTAGKRPRSLHRPRLKKQAPRVEGELAHEREVVTRIGGTGAMKRSLAIELKEGQGTACDRRVRCEFVILGFSLEIFHELRAAVQN
jgi:hypothetical protein